MGYKRRGRRVHLKARAIERSSATARLRVVSMDTESAYKYYWQDIVAYGSLLDEKGNPIRGDDKRAEIVARDAFYAGVGNVFDNLRELFRGEKVPDVSALFNFVVTSQKAVKAYKRGYIPHRKYTPTMYKYFRKMWDKLRSQPLAYDKTAKRFNLDPENGESFIRRHRAWLKEQSGSLHPNYRK